MFRSTRHHRGATLLALTLSLSLTGCGTAATDNQSSVDDDFAHPPVQVYPGIRVTEDVTYGVADSEPLLLDVCEQEKPVWPGERRAILLVHGGSWRAGDQASAAWRSVCEWLASEGLVTVEGSSHSIALLDDTMKARIATFLRTTLGVAPPAAP